MLKHTKNILFTYQTGKYQKVGDTLMLVSLGETLSNLVLVGIGTRDSANTIFHAHPF